MHLSPRTVLTQWPITCAGEVMASVPRFPQNFTPLSVGESMSAVPSIAECQSIVRQHCWNENQAELLMAAATLMESCETNQTINVDDGLACLDHGGVIAEIGARILYVLTGRDGYGWHHAGYKDLPFRVDKQNWLSYLAKQD